MLLRDTLPFVVLISMSKISLVLEKTNVVAPRPEYVALAPSAGMIPLIPQGWSRVERSLSREDQRRQTGKSREIGLQIQTEHHLGFSDKRETMKAS